MSLDILSEYEPEGVWQIDQETREAAATLMATLAEFNIDAEVTGIRRGPVITMFELLPAPGVKISRIVNLADNIALRLAASRVRIVAPIPGKHAVGIEVPNRERAIVSFREIISLPQFTPDPAAAPAGIPVALGKDIAGEAQAPGQEPSLDPIERRLRREREARGGHGAFEDQPHVVQSNARQDGLPETTGADQRSERRGSDVDDR